MLVVERVARIRREFFIKGKSIKGSPFHGVLWIIDRIEMAGPCDATTLHGCLSNTAAHPLPASSW